MQRLLGALSVLLLSSLAGAQDVDVQGNLTMVDSSQTAGSILKNGVPFIHNFGENNTFVGSNAGNLSMSGRNNTAAGGNALRVNTTGGSNTATGYFALFGNYSGDFNTATGTSALWFNSTGDFNTAIGSSALGGNVSGRGNTAVGYSALLFNGTGDRNTAIGFYATVIRPDLTNATAIGYGADVDASNKIRLGNYEVTVIEGQVGFTANSDRNQKENFQSVDPEEVLGKIRELSLNSWNFIGHDPKQFRHYGPMAQDFFAAFGHDGIGTIGTETTITSTDMDGVLMIAAQALEKRTVEQRNEMAALRKETDARTEVLRAENADLKARLDALERRVGSYAVN